MIERDVIVIGGGPAGLSAAGELAARGFTVDLVEQRPSLGGAIFRQPIAGAPSVASSVAKSSFEQLLQGVQRPGVTLRTTTIFLGIDDDGLVMCENRATGHVEYLKARAVIIALGAIENIRPIPGWELPGVSTAGGLQLLMKETGRAPQGRVLLAGSGPLLIAVAAQMAKAGNPPVAVIESGNPLARIGASIGLLQYPSLLAEAAGYMTHLWRSPAPWLRGRRLTRIARSGEALEATVADRHNRTTTLVVDRIGLHDGLTENATGLPDECRAGAPAIPIILRAGDCREALGARAAIADGRRAAMQVCHMLTGGQDKMAQAERPVDRQRRAQARLRKVFAPVTPSPLLSALPDQTILCRCEGRSVGDLKALLDAPDALTGREVKHNGRFAMGACQGRFCAGNTARLMAELRPDAQVPSARDLTGQRWPIRPVSIAALAGTPHDDN